MTLQTQIQSLSELRLDLYEQAGKVSQTNEGQAKALWAAADALVVAMEALGEAESLELKAPEAAFNPWDLLV